MDAAAKAAPDSIMTFTHHSDGAAFTGGGDFMFPIIDGESSGEEMPPGISAILLEKLLEQAQGLSPDLVLAAGPSVQTRGQHRQQQQ